MDGEVAQRTDKKTRDEGELSPGCAPSSSIGWEGAARLFAPRRTSALMMAVYNRRQSLPAFTTYKHSTVHSAQYIYTLGYIILINRYTVQHILCTHIQSLYYTIYILTLYCCNIVCLYILGYSGGGKAT